MPLAQQISPHIPYLRRYARALTGSQRSGDAYVAALLESLLTDTSVFPKGMDPRVALYHAFTNLWKSVRINGERTQGESDRRHTVDAKLEVMKPLARQAFLLMTVEEFAIAETAQILGVSEAEASDLITQAGREIAEQVATEVLIIEDEPIIAMDIETIVRDLGHNVTGVAVTRDEAVSQAMARRPGLVLADIQLADDSSGIDAVKDILAEFSVPVIFITAFPERLLTGTRPEPTFLITKPFQRSTVKAAIAQALFFDAATVPAG